MLAWDVGESDAIELHFAGDGRHRNIVCFVGFLFLWTIDHIAKPLDGERDFLEILPTLCEAHEWCGDIARDDTEGDKLTESQVALNDQNSAIPEHSEVTQSTEQRRHRVHRRGGQNGMETCADKAGIAFLPLPTRGLFNISSLERLHTRECLDEVGLRFGPLLGTAADLGLKDRCSEERDACHEWHNKKSHDCQLHIIEKHDCHVDYGKEGIQADGERCAGEELADIFEFVQAGCDLPHGTALEVAEREFVEVIHDPRTNCEVDAVRGVDKQVGADGCKRDSGNGDQHKKHAEDIQGIDRILDQDLVDDNLREEWVCESEQLNEKRSDENLYEHTLVLANRRQKPSEAKFFLLLLRKRTQ